MKGKKGNRGRRRRRLRRASAANVLPDLVSDISRIGRELKADVFGIVYGNDAKSEVYGSYWKLWAESPEQVDF